MRSEEQKEAWALLKRIYQASPKSRLMRIKRKELDSLSEDQLYDFMEKLEDLIPLIKNFQLVWQEMSEERWEFYERSGSTHLREYRIMQQRAKTIREAFGQIAKTFFGKSYEADGEEPSNY